MALAGPRTPSYRRRTAGVVSLAAGWNQSLAKDFNLESMGLLLPLATYWKGLFGLTVATVAVVFVALAVHLFVYAKKGQVLPLPGSNGLFPALHPLFDKPRSPPFSSAIRTALDLIAFLCRLSLRYRRLLRRPPLGAT